MCSVDFKRIFQTQFHENKKNMWTEYLYAISVSYKNIALSCRSTYIIRYTICHNATSKP